MEEAPAPPPPVPPSVNIPKPEVIASFEHDDLDVPTFLRKRTDIN
jgi:hypothetical protein